MPFIVTLRESNINIELLLFPEGFTTADRRSTARIIVMLNTSTVTSTHTDVKFTTYYNFF